jgi:hypothetical protein
VLHLATVRFADDTSLSLEGQGHPALAELEADFALGSADGDRNAELSNAK